MQLQVIWKRLYKCSSSKDVGTLYQLRNLINRRNVVSDPTRDVTACEEFFLLVVEAHILYAAMDTFGMTSIDDVPSNTDFFPEEATNLDSIQRRNVLLLGVKALLVLLLYYNIYLFQASEIIFWFMYCYMQHFTKYLMGFFGVSLRK